MVGSLPRHLPAGFEVTSDPGRPCEEWGFAVIAGTLAVGKAHCVLLFLRNFQG